MSRTVVESLLEFATEVAGAEIATGIAEVSACVGGRVPAGVRLVEAGVGRILAGIVGGLCGLVTFRETLVVAGVGEEGLGDQAAGDDAGEAAEETAGHQPAHAEPGSLHAAEGAFQRAGLTQLR